MNIYVLAALCCLLLLPVSGRASTGDTPPRLVELAVTATGHESALEHPAHATMAERTSHFTIIESQSQMPDHNMDTHWLTAVTAQGHTGTIVGQTTLDGTAFFSSTDVLVISSGIIPIPAHRRATIQQFLQTGKPVYLQCEYDQSFEANITFAQLVNALGGYFVWTGTVVGDLIPMYVEGTLGTTPYSVPSLSYFWYGCTGTWNATVTTYLRYGSQYFGFIFTPPNPNYGILMTNSDQDWAIRSAQYLTFLQNIVVYLAGHGLPPATATPTQTPTGIPTATPTIIPTASPSPTPALVPATSDIGQILLIIGVAALLLTARRTR